MLAVSSTNNNLHDRRGRVLELVRSKATRPLAFAISAGKRAPFPVLLLNNSETKKTKKETTSPWPKYA